MTESRREEKRAFSLFDKNGDGVITKEELAAALRQLGQKPSDAELTDMIQEVDREGKGHIDYADFLTLTARRMQTSGQQQLGRTLSIEKLAQTTEEDLRDAFKVFDRDGDGLISANEMLLALRDLGEDITGDKVKEMITEADLDGDGKLSYDEFVTFIEFKPLTSPRAV